MMVMVMLEVALAITMMVTLTADRADHGSDSDQVDAHHTIDALKMIRTHKTKTGQVNEHAH